MSFVSEFQAMAEVVHGTAQAHGFWNDEEPNASEKIALMHSELSELLEVTRKPGCQYSETIVGHRQASEELADLVIRAMDFAEGFGLDLSGAIVAKAHYNETRPYKHGKLF